MEMTHLSGVSIAKTCLRVHYSQIPGMSGRKALRLQTLNLSLSLSCVSSVSAAPRISASVFFFGSLSIYLLSDCFLATVFLWPHLSLSISQLSHRGASGSWNALDPSGVNWGCSFCPAPEEFQSAVANNKGEERVRNT